MIRVTSLPALPAIETPLLKEHLRIIGTDEDLTLALYVRAATEIIQVRTNLALITQTVIQSFDKFPTESNFLLECYPVQEILSVKYYDKDNILQTLETDKYFVATDTPPKICLVKNKSWPSTYNRPKAIEVEYRVGFGNTAESVPSDIKEAISLIVGEFILNKEDAHSVQGITVRETFWSSQRLLHRYKPYFYEYKSQRLNYEI